ncbi:MAG: NADH-ubiquinone oxidoreductase subunit NDUFA12 family protein [Alphaproteobacteria bacterium]
MNLNYETMLDTAMNLLRFQNGKLLMGEDGDGNRYYTARSRVRRGSGNVSERRWVVYALARRGLGRGEVPPLPPAWQAWLHHTGEIPDGAAATASAPEQSAYLPRGHRLRSDIRPAATGDYEPWLPPLPPSSSPSPSPSLSSGDAAPEGG